MLKFAFFFQTLIKNDKITIRSDNIAVIFPYNWWHCQFRKRWVSFDEKTDSKYYTLACCLNMWYDHIFFSRACYSNSKRYILSIKEKLITFEKILAIRKVHKIQENEFRVIYASSIDRKHRICQQLFHKLKRDPKKPFHLVVSPTFILFPNYILTWWSN